MNFTRHILLSLVQGCKYHSAFFIASLLVFLPVLSLAVDRTSEPGSEQKLIVDVGWLKKNVTNSNQVIVDTRESEKYLAGHIDGAVNIPVKSTFGEPPNNDLIAPISHIQDVFGKSGIDNNTFVILYDDGEYVNAARVFWVLEVYGHTQVAILDGGFSDWRSNGLPVSKEQPRYPEKSFLPTIVPNILSTKFSTRLAINDTSKLIIDARSIQEYSGTKSKTARFGHIPSAINIPYYMNYEQVQGISRLKKMTDLQQVYKDVNKNKKVITYCNRGRESALTYFILRNLGYNVSTYDGSWVEWSSDKSLPIDAPVKNTE